MNKKGLLLLKFVIGMIIGLIVLIGLIYAVIRITNTIIGEKEEMQAKSLLEKLKNVLNSSKEYGTGFELIFPLEGWNLVYIPSDRNEIKGFKKPNIYFGVGVLCLCESKECKYCVVSENIINDKNEFLNFKLDNFYFFSLIYDKNQNMFVYSLTKEIQIQQPTEKEIEIIFDQYQQISNQKQIIMKAIDNASKKYSIDTSLLLAITKAESNFDENAVSPCGAVGLMQLIPSTAKSYGLIVPEYGMINENAKEICGVEKITACNSLEINGEKKYLKNCDKERDERFNVEKNIDAGARYIADLSKKFPSLSYVVAAYHDGEGKIIKNCDCENNNCKKLPTECIEKDTLVYVVNVLKYKIAFEKAIEKISATV